MVKRTLKDLLNELPAERRAAIELRSQELIADETVRGLLSEVSPETLETLTTHKVSLTEAARRSLSRVHAHAQGANIGIISAERGEHSPEVNDRNHAELGHDIRKAGFGYVPIKGRYIENHGTPHAKTVSERSYMVVGKRGNDSGNLKGFLTKHGEKYKQDSILHKPHDSTKASLHGTSNRPESWPGKGNTHEVGEFHPNRAGEFHSAMKGKRTFAFEGNEYLFFTPKGFSNRKEKLFE